MDKIFVPNGVRYREVPLCSFLSVTTCSHSMTVLHWECRRIEGASAEGVCWWYVDTLSDWATTRLSMLNSTTSLVPPGHSSKKQNKKTSLVSIVCTCVTIPRKIWGSICNLRTFENGLHNLHFMPVSLKSEWARKLAVPTNFWVGSRS